MYLHFLDALASLRLGPAIQSLIGSFTFQKFFCRAVFLLNLAQPRGAQPEAYATSWEAHTHSDRHTKEETVEVPKTSYELHVALVCN